MDILAASNCLKCKIHSNENIIYLKVNDFKNNNKIFYCEVCIEEIDSFITKNFLRIKNILKFDNYIFLKWPPLDNNEVNLQIKEVISQITELENFNFENEIIKFFDDLKNEICQKIESCQKQMLKLASQVLEQNESIFEQFIKFSKVNILQDILKDTTQDSFEKEKQLKDIIYKAQSGKQQNLQQVRKLINEINKQNRSNKFLIPSSIKESILTLLDYINFFSFSKDINILPNFNFESRPFVINNEQYPKKQEMKRMLDNSIEFKCYNDDKQYFYSDFILEQNKKYVFRLQVEADTFENQFVQLGIIDNKFISHHSQDNTNQTVVIAQKFEKKSKMIKFNSRSFRQTKGDLLNVKDDIKMIEFRIELQNKIFEILDYPNYKHKLSINDDIKKQLTENQYRLILFINGEITATLKNAFICELFE